MSDFDYEVNLGKLGEEEFSKWCTSSGLVANRSLEEDTMGWDHLVEFPYIKSNGPQDKQQKPIECKIQVKSTKRTDKGVNIKLSALKRLVDYTSPAFILFYEYDKSASPVLEYSYLVHIDEKLIYRILKKMRQNYILKTPKKLNKIELKVSYNKTHKLLKNTGEAMREKIVSFVPDGIAKYQQSKHELSETVGYEDGGYQFQFNASSNELEAYIMKKALGLATTLKVKNAHMKDTRFKLDGVSINKSDEAQIEVFSNTHDKCKLRFKTNQYSPSISFNAELVKVPSVLTNCNRLLLRTNLFSIELGELNDGVFHSINLHETLDKKVSIEELIRFFRVFNTENCGKSLFLEVDLQELDKPLRLQCTIEHNYIDFSDLVQDLRFLQSSYEIDSSLQVYPEQIVQEEVRVKALCRILRSDVEGLEFKVSDTTESKFDKTRKKVKQLFTSIVVLGDSAFGAVTLLHANKKEDFVYKAYRAEVLQTLAFNDRVPTKELVAELEGRAVSNLQGDYVGTQEKQPEIPSML